MTDESRRTANLLGAAVLCLQDDMKKVLSQQFHRAGEGPAALCALGHQPGLSNDRLSRLLDLTHTGTVRLIDRLVEDGLVERRAAEHDRRTVALFLTEAGEQARENILHERLDALQHVTDCLSAEEQRDLARLLEKILQATAGDDTHKLRTCRLCDSRACTDCPILVPVNEGA